MTETVSSFLAILSALLVAPVLLHFVEIVASFRLPAGVSMPAYHNEPRPTVVILVPAHNEDQMIQATVSGVKVQLLPGDRILVIADNCTDDTAKLAAAAGAEVIERHDPINRGKGHALAFGVSFLANAPPSVVIIIDADCKVSDAGISQLAKTCLVSRRPVQALDLMIAPSDSSTDYRLAQFAWRIKNWVRPLGLKALGLPCQLMGTGMAFPWEVISQAKLATGSIVEDVKLGLDLAQQGKPPLFDPTVIVTSYFPASAEGAAKQRARWESGHLNMIFAKLPFLLYRAIAQRNLNLFALVWDLAIPPLSALALMLVGMCLISGIGLSLGLSPIAFVISSASTFLFGCGVFLAWWKFGRDLIPPILLLSVPSYIGRKLPIYRRFLSRPRANLPWIRTDRRRSK